MHQAEHIHSHLIGQRIATLLLLSFLLLPLLPSDSALGLPDPPATNADQASRDAVAWGVATKSERESHRIDNAAPRSDRAAQDEAQLRVIAIHLDVAKKFAALTDNPTYAVRAHWRGARAIWLAGEALPHDDIERRIERFTQADEMVSRGLELDDLCAECMLWKFNSMGRLYTTVGGISAARNASEMAELLGRGIELKPTHSDSPNNSALGNLHYASAIFYRVVPDWFWLEWIIGVRGDKERALEHIESALKIHPMRLDFKVELGSQLLCQGATKRGQKKRLKQGIEVLEAVLVEEPKSYDEARELEAAKIMLLTPEIACGYTGDRFLEINEEEARKG